MVLLHPLWLALLVLLPLPWVFFKRREYLPHSNVGMLGVKSGGWLRRLPLAAFSIGLALLSVCLARPQVRVDSAAQVIMSRDIIVAVDISGSMGSPFNGEIPPLEKSNPELDKQLPPAPKAKDPRDARDPYAERYAGKRRIDAAQSAVLRFVRHRFDRAAGDRVGIEVFDFSPRWSWPLTDDLKMIYRKGLFVDSGLGGGTNFGSYNPGPIDAAAEHFDERGQAGTKVIIMVTDGEDYIDDGTMARLVAVMSSRNIKLYVIGVGDDLARANFDIFRLAKAVGGETFKVSNGQEMARCMDSIDEMERSPVQIMMQPHFYDIFHYFAIGALVALFLAIMGEALIVSH